MSASTVNGQRPSDCQMDFGTGLKIKSILFPFSYARHIPPPSHCFWMLQSTDTAWCYKVLFCWGLEGGCDGMCGENLFKSLSADLCLKTLFFLSVCGRNMPFPELWTMPAFVPLLSLFETFRSTLNSRFKRRGENIPVGFSRYFISYSIVNSLATQSGSNSGNHGRLHLSRSTSVDHMQECSAKFTNAF